MFNIFQKTINKPISFEGVGLHSGLISKVKIMPSSNDNGIIFKRVDLKKDNEILANYNNVSSAKLCTTLTNSNGAFVSTVEHLMAAFYITGIDNALVEINNEEVPIMDGSSKDFVKFIEEAGVKNLTKKRKFLKILKEIKLEEGSKSISIEPNNLGFSVDFELSYKNPIINNQRNVINFYNQDLENVISSRTFCLYEDIEKIKSLGLAKGGSLNNAVVIQDNKILNETGLRNEKEFVNHKILDLAGDFLLSGYRILGDVKCTHGGHQLTNSFLKEIFKSRSNFTEVSLETEVKFLNNTRSINHKVAVNA